MKKFFSILLLVVCFISILSCNNESDGEVIHAPLYGGNIDSTILSEDSLQKHIDGEYFDEDEIDPKDLDSSGNLLRRD